MKTEAAPVVAIFGGAVSGAEAAELLSRRGIYTVVFEQNALPYGKIEDGLPKWHVKLRNKEEQKIDEKLDHTNVFYVPNTKLGRDLDFVDVARNWGFSAVLLATGAWRDRPLPIAGIDEYIGKGLYYQNPFIYWFNHYHEPDFSGEGYEIPDGAIVVGGGLASIDVVKALMIVTVHRALEQRGHSVDPFALEKKGPAQVLQTLGLSKADLGLRGCALYYRRQIHLMPITPIPPDADERRIAKAHEVRQRMMTKLQDEFLFDVHELHAPVDKIVEHGRLAGLAFQRTKIEGNRVVPIPGELVQVRSPLVISSIGSIPELLPGIPATGSIFDLLAEETGQVRGFDHVFALGNAVTGRGNIKESRVHGIGVARYVADAFLGWPEAGGEPAAASRVCTPAQIEAILARVRECQQTAGYDGNYKRWVQRHLPKRLEDLLGLDES